MGSVKHAGNLVVKTIAKHTGLKSGTEVKYRALVWVVVLVLGVRFNYVVAVDEKKKDKGF